MCNTTDSQQALRRTQAAARQARWRNAHTAKVVAYNVARRDARLVREGARLQVQARIELRSAARTQRTTLKKLARDSHAQGVQLNADASVVSVQLKKQIADSDAKIAHDIDTGFSNN